VRRATAPDFLESVANHPRVRPYIGGSGEFRCGDSWARTIALEWDDGGVVFLEEGPGVYSAHLVFLPKAKDVLGKCQQAMAYLMPQHADRLLCDFPSRYRHVRKIVERCGLTHHSDAHGWAHYFKDES
jgi:hypothetical protein